MTNTSQLSSQAEAFTRVGTMLSTSYAVGRMIYGRRLAHLTEEETKDFREEFGGTWNLVQTLLGHRNPQTTASIYLEPFRSLEVELLLTHVEGVAVSAFMRDLFADERRVLGDPLASTGGLVSAW